MKRYFFMEQDKKITDCISLRDFDIRGSRTVFHQEDADRINDTTILYLKDRGGETEQDFFQSPVTMVSKKMARVLSMYENNIILKKIILIGKEEQKQFIYYLPLFNELDCLSDRIERYPNGMEKKMILDMEKIGSNKVFVTNSKTVRRPVVSIEVVESMMRRQLVGIIFEEIEVI